MRKAKEYTITDVYTGKTLFKCPKNDFKALCRIFTVPLKDHHIKSIPETTIEFDSYVYGMKQREASAASYHKNPPK